MNETRYYLLFFTIIVLTSCNSGEDNNMAENRNGDSINNQNANNQNANRYQAGFERLIWKTDVDTIKGEFFLVKNRDVNADTLTPQKLISEINSVWRDIFLEFKKVSNDTIYVAIPKSEHLTQRMGTSGAANYMASTTYTLTELQGIKYVNFDFEEGDHLAPGIQTREDYKNYR